jgi:hypothetical protein
MLGPPIFRIHAFSSRIQCCVAATYTDDRSVGYGSVQYNCRQRRSIILGGGGKGGRQPARNPHLGQPTPL